MKSKKCNKCGEVKTVDCFSKDKAKKDGLMSNCKECVKKYKQENKNKIREYHKNYRQENKEKVQGHYKKHYQENRDKLREYHKKYYRENRGYYKKYYQENKEKLREYQKNRYNTDPLFKLKDNLRGSIKKYLKNGKSKRTSEILGCS